MRTSARPIALRHAFSRALAPAAIGALLLLVAPLAARAGSHHTNNSYSFGTSSLDDARFGWALFDPRSGDSSVQIGDGEVWTDVLGQLKDERGEVLWCRLDGRAYLVRDPEWVSRADDIVAPVRELGRQQGRLGAKQGELGAKQGAIGAKQGRLGLREAALATKLAELAADADRDGDRDARREARDLEAELEAVRDEQAALAREQEPLSQAQSEMGRQQTELGREQSRASAHANDELRRLVEQAIREGKAIPFGRHRAA